MENKDIIESRISDVCHRVESDGENQETGKYKKDTEKKGGREKKNMDKKAEEDNALVTKKHKYSTGLSD